MKQQLLRAASVCALTLAMGGAVVAQSGGGGGAPGGGGAQGPSGGPGVTEREKMGPGGTGGGETRPAPRSGTGDARDKAGDPRGKGGSAERPSDRQQKSGQRQPDSTAPKSSDRSQDPDDRKGAPRSSEQRKDGPDRQRATGREQDKDRRTGQGEQQKDRRTGQGEQQKDRRTGERSGGGDGKDQARTQLSEQQRTNVRERLSRSGSRNRVTNVNFDIRVGATVPRNVTLHVLPPDVVEIVPAYSSYRYVYVGDDFVIIDPVSYRIVTVISSGSRTAGVRRRSLNLAADDRVYIRQHIDRGFALKLGIGGISIGMNVPDTVELRPLPVTVVERVPDLRDYRYFVYEDDIAIVDPDTHEVVTILED